MSISKKHKKRREKDIYRPLPRKSLDRAKAIVGRYQMTLWREDGEWFGQGVEEPGVYADGRTMAECARNLRQALAIAVGWNIEDGLPIVQPVIDQEPRRKAG